MGPQRDLYVTQALEKPRDNVPGSGQPGGLRVHQHGLDGPSQAVLGCVRVAKAL